MTGKTNRCGTCAWYRQRSLPINWSGYCMVNPPTVLMGDDGPNYERPLVEADDYCSHWTRWHSADRTPLTTTGQ